MTDPNGGPGDPSREATADAPFDAAEDASVDLPLDDSLDVSKGARHSAREVALQVLYAVDLGATGLRAAQADRDARDAAPPSGPAALAGAPTEFGPRTARPQPSDPKPGIPFGTAAGPATQNRAGSRTGAPRMRPLEAASRAKQEEELAQAERERVRLEAVAARTPAETSAEAFTRVSEHFEVPASAVAFARSLVDRVVEHTTGLDELIGLHARNWRVSRMAAVDRNVLRLAVYELRDTDTPVAVVIDEAVDLARRFGSETSPAFVNGILDAIAREVRAA